MRQDGGLLGVSGKFYKEQIKNVSDQILIMIIDV